LARSYLYLGVNTLSSFFMLKLKHMLHWKPLIWTSILKDHWWTSICYLILSVTIVKITLWDQLFTLLFVFVLELSLNTSIQTF